MKDMNNKNPQWRQEMEDIFKMLESAEGRLHEALKESHFANNQSNDSIKSDKSQEAPPVGNLSKVHKVIFEPYDYTKAGFHLSAITGLVTVQLSGRFVVIKDKKPSKGKAE